MKEPILSREEVFQIAARLGLQSLNVTRVHELNGPTRTIFDNAGLEEFAAALESALLEKLCGEPVAWMVLECVHLKPCSVTLDREDIEGHRPEHVVSLYALNWSKA